MQSSCGYLPLEDLRNGTLFETTVTLIIGLRKLCEEMGDVYGLLNGKYKTRIYKVLIYNLLIRKPYGKLRAG
jgi:hypothetical protein